MEVIKNKRGRVKGTVTRIAAFCDNITSDTTLESVQLRLEKLNEAWTDFQGIQNEMYEHCGSENFTDQEPENAQFEERYYRCKEILSVAIRDRFNQSNVSDQGSFDRFVDQQTTFLERFSSTYANSVPHNSESKLPKIQIAPFSGDYKEWISFRDLYEGAVHQNNKLTSCQKFHYLKGLLRDEAAALLRHIPISEANYNEAWQRLTNRYDKKGPIISSLIKTFFNLPSVSTSSASGLRHIHDRFDEIIRGLRAIGDDAETRDPWIIFHILNKVDPTTRQEWAKTTVKNDFPKIEDLLQFLDERCIALESAHGMNRIPSAHKQIKANMSIVKPQSIATSTCPKCNNNHSLFQCTVFRSMNLDERRKFVKDKNLCYNCLRGGHASAACKSTRFCQHCQRRHHTLVHMSPTSNAEISKVKNQQQNSCNPVINNPSLSANHSLVETRQPILQSRSLRQDNCQSLSLLPTALAYAFDFQGKTHTCRLLLDSGSQASFVTESFVHKLGLCRKHARFTITGLSSAGAGITKGVVTINIKSRINCEAITIQAFILDQLTSVLPGEELDIDDFENISSLELADPTFNKPSCIDLLLGADKMFQILREGRVGLYPTAQCTIFGWVIAGELPHYSDSNDIISSLVSTPIEIDLDRMLFKFWEIENIPATTKLSPEERMAEEIFQRTVKRASDGKYIVELPFKDPTLIGNSLQIALNRLNCMERRFAQNPSLREQYVKFMKDYLSLHHMEIVPVNELDLPQVYYLPHHAILKPDSSTTKLRVVFDGSCKPANGISLNEALLVGPTIQRDLFSICLRFRRHKYVFSADIEKMYRQIWVAEKHRDFQRIVWRETTDGPIQHYRLCTVTYGTASAPFLAIRTLQQMAMDYQNEMPAAATVLLNDFYVDDVMSGADTISDILQIKTELIKLLQYAGCSLRKWSTNCWPLLTSIPEADCELSALEFNDESKSIKTLGLLWHPSADAYSFKVCLPPVDVVTKRNLLSDASRIFDPLGFLTPVTVSIKILFQHLWLLNLKWDDSVPTNIENKWRHLRNDLNILNSIRIPRLIKTAKRIEYHGFSDASESAYAAVIYCRSFSDDACINVRIVAAKSKVAPLKQINLPRLELCAAVLLSRLIQRVFQSMEIATAEIHAWTDSQIVLHWLSSIPRRWKSFIANRTAEILDTLPRSCWHHIRSKSNPADCATRGILPSDLINNDLWWHGPSWLRVSEDKWPSSLTPELSTIEASVAEERNIVITSMVAESPTSVIDAACSRISSWSKLTRTLAFCYRFVKNLRVTRTERVYDRLQVDEIAFAKLICLKHAQDAKFFYEKNMIKQGKSLSSHSKLIKLSPFLDKDDLLRVGGRIRHAELSYQTRHPIILPKGHIITLLIMRDSHFKHLHAGVSELFSILRQEYWILGCRNMLKKIVHDCIPCFRQRSTSIHQQMADLPKHRVTYARPFINVGCDYAGPLTLRLSRGRNPKYTKGYIALFVCCTTKAIHLELVGDLTTESFIAALRRFMGRRGKCLHIFSDNGTNFRGADRLISNMYEVLNSQAHNNTVKDHLSQEGISWSFIPPAAPHFGGLWEAGVRATKQHLKRVIGNSILTYEEMNTVLIQIEALLNSRPLCAMSDNDLNALTPAHFLIGHPYTTLPDADCSEIPPSRLTNWELLQNMTRGFWKRWHLDYLTSLQQRPKWYNAQPEIKKGNLVVVKEPNLPPASWVLARVEDTHPGDDGRTRVITVRTANGLLKRPITKIVPLPIS